MTNKDYLSQDEIDALLKQTATSTEVQATSHYLSADQFLTSLEQDALGEIGNITFGNAATALSTLLGKKVDITTPKVSAIARNTLEAEFPQPHVAVHVKYVEGFYGINLLVIKKGDAQIIADLMMGGTGTVGNSELTELHISAVQEAMNQMMGSSATSMSTIFNRFVNISPPGIDILDFSDGGQSESSLPQEDVFIKVSFRLMIDGLIDSNIMQLLPVQFAKDIVSSLLGSNEPSTPVSIESEGAITPPLLPAKEDLPLEQAQILQQDQPQLHVPQQPQYHMPQQPQQQMPNRQVPQQPYIPQTPLVGADPSYGGMTANNRNVNVQPVQFSGFQDMSAMPQVDQTNLGLLLDIPLKVTVELGRTQKQIKDILELSQGSIIELDKLAGEPVDILVNNKYVAKGEVVVIDENFGVRVTDIVNQWDRVQKL